MLAKLPLEDIDCDRAYSRSLSSLFISSFTLNTAPHAKHPTNRVFPRSHISVLTIIDIYRQRRYITFIVITDKLTMRQILSHSTQLGQILASRRKALKLSQQALAAKLTISQNRLSEIETNPGTLTVERLLDLCNLLGLELVIQNRPTPQRPSKTEW